MNLTTQLHLVPILKMCRAIPRIPPDTQMPLLHAQWQMYIFLYITVFTPLYVHIMNSRMLARQIPVIEIWRFWYCITTCTTPFCYLEVPVNKHIFPVLKHSATLAHRRAEAHLHSFSTIYWWSTNFLSKGAYCSVDLTYFPLPIVAAMLCATHCYQCWLLINRLTKEYV
jgi:hypothetical protein